MNRETSRDARVGAPAAPVAAQPHDWPYLCSVLLRALEPFPEARIAAAAAIDAQIEHPKCPTCGRR